MKRIAYMVTLADGGRFEIVVEARSINSGFAKALPLARARARGEINKVEFWEVRS